MLTTLITIVSIALVGLVGYDLYDIWQRKEEAKAKEREEKKAKREAQIKALREKAEAEYSKEYNSLIAKYGEVTCSFLLGPDKNRVSDYLYIFESSSSLMLRGEEIPFCKILGFSLNDDQETIMRNEMDSIESVTSTNTGSMVGRAAVGGLLLGGVGALAGATTAKKETVSQPISSRTTTTIKHKYNLYINVDDLSNPIRDLSLGSDTKRAQTIANVFNVIVQRNK